MSMKEHLEARAAPPSVHLFFLLDKSGSMEGYTSYTIEAFNRYLRTLRECKGAEIRISLIQFGSTMVKTYFGKQIQDAPEINESSYRAGDGHTKLLQSITEVIELAEKAHKPGEKTIVCIQTDGNEAGSPERYSWESVSAKVKKAQTLDGWEFNFLGCSQASKAYQQADRLGIPRENTILYGGENSTEAFEAAATNAAKFSTGRSAHASFTEDQRKAIERG